MLEVSKKVAHALAESQIPSNQNRAGMVGSSQKS